MYAKVSILSETSTTHAKFLNESESHETLPPWEKIREIRVVGLSEALGVVRVLG